MKLYCDEMIMELFYKQTKNKQIEILFNSLTDMSMCNSNSEIYCIANSMGFKKDYNNNCYIKK